MTDPTTPRPDAPAHGVHVIPEQVPEGAVPPSTSMTPPDTARPDVPQELVDAAWPVCEREGIPWHDHAVRLVLAAVLPAHAQQVRERVAEQIEARVAEHLAVAAQCDEGDRADRLEAIGWYAKADHLAEGARIARGES